MKDDALEWAAVVDDEQERSAFYRSRWPAFGNLFLGAWLIAHPLAAGTRSLALFWSDIVAGCFVLAFAGASLKWGSVWLRWALAAIGIWLLSAPLLFWAPTPAEYGNDTLV